MMRRDELLEVLSDLDVVRRHSADGGGYSYREGLLWIGDTKGESGRIEIHEWFHFFEHASTPMGLVRTEFHLRQLRNVISFLSSYPDRIFVPILEWGRIFRLAGNKHPSVPDCELFDRLISCHIGPWTRCAWLEEAFDGIGPLVAKIDTVARAADVLASVEAMSPPWALDDNVSNRGSYESLSVSRNDTERVCLSPRIELNTESGSIEVPIAGLHLSEAMAQILEGVRTGQINNLSHEYAILIKLIFRCWVELGLAINSTTQRTIAYTCLALADLSLFTPIGAVYGSLRPVHQKWIDIHPGHRFLQALGVTIDTQSWITNLDEAEGLSNLVCDRLGWIQPRRFLELGSNTKVDDLNASAHRHACQVRLDRFSAFMEPSLWEEPLVIDFIDTHMPMSYTHDVGFVCPVSLSDPSLAAVRLRNYAIARFCWFVMKGNHVIQMSDLLPAAFPYARHFDRLYASPHSFFQLLQDTHPWASLERISPLIID